ncbi:protein FdhE [Luteimonas padinae]|uniref:Protein FdhE homolog n=1 Tax=Luteimonas padinae TaxID=1714359 RepID=A0ABV6SZ20_9GAMM|nr:formate dehydrogenase accessory protein FdhE [Luteimonas padinae]GHD66120.1 protein FdhE [Luteimonas padinae]
MPRILPRGEIENLDHTRIPRLRIPERAGVFSDRAARLRSLADASTIEGYLRLMARLAEAQQRALKSFEAPAIDDDVLAQARRHEMPPLPATGLARDPAWRALLARLLDEVAGDAGTPAQAVAACNALAHTLDTAPERVEQMADALLAGRVEGADVAPAPFVMAALQVYWTAMASGLRESQLPVGAFGLCPTCGTPPVASVVRIGGAHDGYRYLCCPLCSCEWHLERVKCSHCATTKGIAYHYIEGGRDGVKAEACDGCRSYRKIFYQDKDPFMEPVADDLGSLALDMLMGEEGYARRSGSPLLWQDTGD